MDAACLTSILHPQACEWRETLRVAALFGRDDLIETVVAPSAAEAAATFMVLPQLLDPNTACLLTQIMRLHVPAGRPW